MKLNEKATRLVEKKLEPMIRNGRLLERIVMNVSSESLLANVTSIETCFGTLRVKTNYHLPKGASYLLEGPGRKGRAFEWIVTSHRHKTK